tara:strand:- start:430 stop:645 length:216 start_codon:yes stop_codon:yes gene_type:complete
MAYLAAHPITARKALNTANRIQRDLTLRMDNYPTARKEQEYDDQVVRVAAIRHVMRTSEVYMPLINLHKQV